MTNGKKALITGIKGFTGQYMAADLSAAGYEVYGFGSTPAQNSSRYFQVDLTNAAQVKMLLTVFSLTSLFILQPSLLLVIPTRMRSIV